MKHTHFLNMRAGAFGLIRHVAPAEGRVARGRGRPGMYSDGI